MQMGRGHFATFSWLFRRQAACIAIFTNFEVLRAEISMKNGFQNRPKIPFRVAIACRAVSGAVPRKMEAGDARRAGGAAGID
jgi:hypothetical protein